MNRIIDWAGEKACVALSAVADPSLHSKLCSNNARYILGIFIWIIVILAVITVFRGLHNERPGRGR